MNVVHSLWNTVFPKASGTTANTTTDPSQQQPLRTFDGSELVPLISLTGHTDRVWNVAWNPSGTLLATCGADRYVCIFDSTGQCVNKLEVPHDRTVRRVGWSPDGFTLATCSFDATVALWSVSPDGKKIEEKEMLEGHDHEVKCCAWDSTGELLATCSRDKTVWIWTPEEPQDARVDDDKDDLPQYECMAVLTGHSQDVKYVTWHPTLEEVYSCSYDDSIRIWVQSKARDGEWFCDATLHGHTSTVWQLSIDPVDPTRMISVSDDGTAIVWVRKAVENGWKRSTTISGDHDGTIYTVSWSTANVLATGGADNSIIIYEERDMSTETVGGGGGGGIPQVGFSQRCVIRGAHHGDVNCVQWNPTNPTILASCGDDGVVKIWQYK